MLGHKLWNSAFLVGDSDGCINKWIHFSAFSGHEAQPGCSVAICGLWPGTPNGMEGEMEAFPESAPASVCPQLPASFLPCHTGLPTSL